MASFKVKSYKVDTLQASRIVSAFSTQIFDMTKHVINNPDMTDNDKEICNQLIREYQEIIAIFE